MVVKKKAAKTARKGKTPKVPDILEDIQAPHHFSSEEIAALNVQLHAALATVETLEDQKKSAVKDFALRIQNAENEVKLLRNKVSSGSETRSMRAITTFDTKKGEVIYLHPETREEVLRQPMQPAHWQLPMFKPADDGKTEKIADRGSIDAGVKPLPTEKKGKKKEKGANAGETNLGNVLDKQVSLTNAPKITLDLTLDWQEPALMKEFRKEAKKAGWTEAQIGLLRDLLKECADVAAMKDTLRDHVQSANPAN